MQLKRAVLALAIAGTLSAQAYANEAQVEVAIQPAHHVAFTEVDVRAMFETSDRPMQLAALSPQEMKETEGAYWFVYYYAPQLTAAAMWAYSASPRLGYTLDNVQYNYWPQVTSWWNSW